MNVLEDQLRQALAERAAQSPMNPAAWDKTVARSRRRIRLGRPGWFRAGFVVPAAAAAAVVAIVVAAAAVTGGLAGGRGGPGQHSLPPAAANAGQAGPKPPGKDVLAVHDLPPVTPFVRAKFSLDGHTVWDFLWFGYVPGYARLGIALCQFNDGGTYGGWSGCTSGALPAGTLARSTATDGSGLIRVGVSAPQVTSVKAVLPGGQTVTGVVRAVRGVPYKVWAVSYPPQDAARIVFKDAAGRQVTQLNLPSGDIPAPSRPRSGGIRIYKYAGQWVTAYRISGDRVGFWWEGDSSWSQVPVSQAPLTVETAIQGPQYAYGYAPADASRVTIRLADGRQYSSPTRPGWSGSGISFWGPVGPVSWGPATFDTIVITYDSAGHVLQEVPLIFLG
ncbi:MAG: hypothetical protein ACRDPY_16405 [Streptosporangiaceae bacterium]